MIEHDYNIDEAGTKLFDIANKFNLKVNDDLFANIELSLRPIDLKAITNGYEIIKICGPFNNENWISPRIPVWAEPLPEKLDIGKKAIINSYGSWTGRTGVIIRHTICGDDCAGAYGQHIYTLKEENGNILSSIPVKDCKIINEESSTD